MLFDQLTYDPSTGEVNDFNVLMWVGLNSQYSSGVKGTTINGKIKPKMKMYPGEVQRWRMIHKGFRTTLALDFPTSDSLEILRIAVDGVMFDSPQELSSIHMAPGNRVDLLVKAHPKMQAGKTIEIKSTKYISTCEYFPEDANCNADNEDQLETLMTIVINGQGPEMNMPSKLPPRAPELQEDVDLPLMGERTTEFYINGGKFMINNKEFNYDRVDEVMILDSADQWKVSSNGGQAHPYHIHINPFQVWSYNGRDIENPQWRDVMMATGDNPAYIRSRYVQYTGDFVIHCHILDHEDQGMMQHVRIAETGADPVGLDPELTYPPQNN
jgi:FtsP/CotA-like multicopper oxidase with cupredoxin domain